jgi:hypothetical protein
MIPAMIARRLVALILATACGCAASRYRGPALLAGGGMLLAGGGSLAFAVGDRTDPATGRESSATLERTGAISLGVGVIALLVAGAWAAVRASCDVDADCPESEACQRIFTTAGPYGHCVPR